MHKDLPFDHLVDEHSADADLVITGVSLTKVNQDSGAFLTGFPGGEDILFACATQDILFAAESSVPDEARNEPGKKDDPEQRTGQPHRRGLFEQPSSWPSYLAWLRVEQCPQRNVGIGSAPPEGTRSAAEAWGGPEGTGRPEEGPLHHLVRVEASEDSRPTSTSFSDDGTVLAVGYDNGVVQLAVEGLVALAERRLSARGDGRNSLLSSSR